MSHDLEIRNGKVSMAYAGEVPWHGLGVEVSNDLTPTQMLEAANLNWTVEKVPMYVDFNEKKIQSTHQALIRSSDESILTIVGEGWEPCQNHEAFDFFKDFVSSGDMEMNTAGALNDGKNVWALAKVNDSFELFGGDRVESFLLFSNPHEYGKSITVMFSPIRVVCNNTLTMSLGLNKEKVKVNHRRKFDADEVKKALGIASHKLTKYKEAAEMLGKVEFTDKRLKKYFSELFPSSKEDKISRTVKNLLEAVREQPGTEYAPNSYWQAYNAVTFLADHRLGRNADTRLQSSWFGINQSKKMKAMDLALKYAKEDA